MDKKFLAAIELARRTPLMPNALKNTTRVLSDISFDVLQDLADIVLAYGFPSYENGYIIRLPVISHPPFDSRAIVIALDQDKINIFVGQMSKMRREATFANGVVFWEASWLVEEVLENLQAIDEHMKNLGFFVPEIGERLNLFSANLPIPVDRIFLSPGTYYILSPEADELELIERFDQPEELSVVTGSTKRFLTRTCDVNIVRQICDIADRREAERGRILDPMSYN